jgi:hypothetical protein
VGWFSALSSARLLVIAVLDGEFPGNETAFRQAAREVQIANFGSVEWCGQRIELLESTSSGLLPNAPVAKWNGSIPRDLADRWRQSTDLEMAAVSTIGSIRILAPKALISPGPLARDRKMLNAQLRLSAGWALADPRAGPIRAVSRVSSREGPLPQQDGRTSAPSEVRTWTRMR